MLPAIIAVAATRSAKHSEPIVAARQLCIAESFVTGRVSIARKISLTAGKLSIDVPLVAGAL